MGAPGYEGQMPGGAGPPGAMNNFGAAAQAASSNPTGSESQVYVGNLDPNVNNQMLLAFFKKEFPSCYDAKIIMDPVTKNSKGFGFIKFGSQEAAQ